MTMSTIDPRWRDAFVVALRMRDVPPERIADQLKIVETHCAESGEPAEEAFGDPTEYAITIAPEAPKARDELSTLLPAAVVGLLAGLLLVEGLLGLIEGRPVTVTVGDLAGAAVLVAAALLAVTFAFRRRKPLLPSFVVAGGGVALAVVLSLWLPQPLLDLPAALALVTALALLAGMIWWTIRAARTQRITDPVTGAPML